MIILLPLLASSYSSAATDPLDPCLAFRGIGLTSPNQFTSPNFPDRYPPNIDCIRIIRSRPDHDVTVQFHQFFNVESTYDKVEAGQDCPNDFIEFRDGRYGFSPLIARLCGNQMPKKEIRAVSGFLWIRFRSDSMLEYQGFSAQYFFVPTKSRKANMHECLMEYLNGLDGFVRTSDLLTSLPINVSGTLDCVWRLSVPSEYRIAFYVHQFTLSSPNLCARNFMEVYSGDTADRPIRRFCGLSATDVFSTTNEMYIRFFLSDVRLLNSTRVTGLFSSYTRKKNCTTAGLFACGDENCVPQTLACNGRSNCPYGRDERVCGVGGQRLASLDQPSHPTAQDTAVRNFVSSGFAPLLLLIVSVFVVVTGICTFTIRKNKCGLPPLD